MKVNYVRTFRGVKIDIDKMSHQHVSNWIYYSRHVIESRKNENFFLRVLEKRFNGVLLMYKPSSELKYEIEILKEKGMIEEDTGKVFFKNKQIGQVV